MPHIRVNLYTFLLIVLSSTALTGQVPEDVRLSIDRIIGSQGAYIPDDGVYKVVLPRAEATIVWDYQTLSPNLGLNSWVAFKSGIHDQAMLTGELLLMDDEVDSVINAALAAGLNITGLASSSIFDGPHLDALDVNATGSFHDLAASYRKCLDEIQHVRRANGRPKTTAPDAPLESSIDPAPLDAMLSTHGSVVNGAYRAEIGSNALLGGEQVGREMGMSTWISIAGDNAHAVAHGEFLATSEDLQRVLQALRTHGMSILSIRNHTVGERPQSVFVQFRGEGAAIELARAVRYALNAQLDRSISALSPRDFQSTPDFHGIRRNLLRAPLA